MLVIAFLFLLIPGFSLYAADGMSSDLREEARNFIRTCFDQLEQMQEKKVKKLEKEVARIDEIINGILKAEQIDFRKFNTYEAQKEIYETDMHMQELYQKSLKRPGEKIVQWDENREAEACALYAYMVLSDEWQQYKADSQNMQVYEQLHKRMESMAKMVTQRKGDRMFVSGTHAYPLQSDAKVDYEVDKVFFLTLFLLNKDLQAQREARASSSQ